MSICTQNVDSASFDTAISILSSLYKISLITLLSILFKSNLPLFNYKKTDKKLVNKFLWQNICCYMRIKHFLLKSINLCKYTLKIIEYIVIIGRSHLSPDIWPKTFNQDTGIENINFTT